MSKIFEMQDPGCHTHGDRLLRKGDKIETDDPLDEVFPGRFVAVGIGVNGKSSPQLPPDSPHINIELEEAEKPMSRLGDDVSVQFASAAKKDLKVYKDNKYYRIADADDIHTPVDDGSLNSKAKVEAFIKKFKG